MNDSNDLAGYWSRRTMLAPRSTALAQAGLHELPLGVERLQNQSSMVNATMLWLHHERR